LELGVPKFSKKDRHAINLGRYYSLQQVEYYRNLIFRRNFPIHKLFERSCDLGLLRLSADRIAQVFGWRLHRVSEAVGAASAVSLQDLRDVLVS
jgi:hypothetical protein